jgi:hypothetical protein
MLSNKYIKNKTIKIWGATHELQKSGEIDVKQIRSSDNLSDLFTKALPTATFKKLVNNIGMRQLKDLSS